MENEKDHHENDAHQESSKSAEKKRADQPVKALKMRPDSNEDKDIELKGEEPPADLQDSLDAPASEADEEASSQSFAPHEGGHERPGGADDLANMSKTQLYDRAKALNIPNRSNMTKVQLLNAIQQASRPLQNKE